MDQSDIRALEAAGRSAMAWAPELESPRPHLLTIAGAAIVALTIIAAAAAILLFPL
ncbi:MAG: hypothetical protein ABL866_02955 [Devosia sp.]